MGVGGRPCSVTAADCRACGSPAAPDPSYPGAGLYRCASCGLLFAPGGPRASYDSDYFERYPGGEAYEADEPQRRYEARLRVELVRRHADGGRLLEIGSAAGFFLDEARRAGFEPVGIEPAREVAEAASRRFGLPVTAALVEDAPLEERAFDVACGWHALEHIPEPAPALERLRGSLRPGGLLVLEVPNAGSVTARRQGMSWFHLDLDHHVAHYAPRSLRALLERAGFAVLATESFPALGYLRPARALHPRSLVAQAKELARVRALPRRPHPWKHELLRAVARA